MTSVDTNLQTYEAVDVAAHYAALDYLTPCEGLLFETYIRQGSAILDLGVGGGRTTACLAKRASHYVGVDYSVAMVNACRKKFPNLQFVVGDAADLSCFPSASFDVAVFAFNGIDYVLPDHRRRSCLEQVRRILKDGGFLIFSSHNPRSFMVRPNWNRERLRQMARRCSAGVRVLYWPAWTILTALRAALAFSRAAGSTLLRAMKRIPSPMFWHGEGTLMDSVHGGLLTHYSTPPCVIKDLSTLHFHPVRILGDDYPRRSHPYVTDWYYYVFTKHCEK